MVGGDAGSCIPVVCVSLYRVRFVLNFCLFVIPLMGKAERGDNPVC